MCALFIILIFLLLAALSKSVVTLETFEAFRELWHVLQLWQYHQQSYILTLQWIVTWDSLYNHSDVKNLNCLWNDSYHQHSSWQTWSLSLKVKGSAVPAACINPPITINTLQRSTCFWPSWVLTSDLSDKVCLRWRLISWCHFGFLTLLSFDIRPKWQSHWRLMSCCNFGALAQV